MLNIYFATVIGSWLTQQTLNSLHRKELKKEGYIFIKKTSILDKEPTLKRISKKLIPLTICAFPVINVAVAATGIFNYEKIHEKLKKTGLELGNMRKSGTDANQEIQSNIIENTIEQQPTIQQQPTLQPTIQQQLDALKKEREALTENDNEKQRKMVN